MSFPLRRQGLLLVALAVTLSLAWAPAAHAQRDTGVMVVRALDPDGQPLPGVTVVATGPVGTQTQYTGLDGSARFPGLYPGEGYTATFTMDGFKTVVREGLVVRAGRTLSFDLTMELTSVEETITVTGESPLVDTKTSKFGAMITDELLDNTPTASGLWAGVLDHVPGILNSLDVGGGDSGQQTSPVAFGSETRNNTYNVNGGDTTDPAAVGASSSYFSTGAFEEVSVQVASQDVEVKTPGVNMNMVVKSGSNDWSAAAKMFWEDDSFVSSNVDDELRAEGVTEGTPNELLTDLDLQVGGPLVRDRAWFFFDYWDFELKKVVLGLEERDGTELTDYTFNGTFQVNDNHKVSGRFLRTEKFRNNRGASQAEPFIGRIQESDTLIPQVQWQSVLSQNLFLDVRFSSVRSDFPLVRRDNDSRNPLPGYVNRPATFDFATNDYVPRPANPPSEFFDERDTDNLNGTTSYYLTRENSSHDIKFGGSWTGINYFAPSNNPHGYRPYVRSNLIGDPDADPNNNPNWSFGVPQEVRLYNTTDAFVMDSVWKPDNAFSQVGTAIGLFGQDTWTIANRLTITGGLRVDTASNGNPAQNRLDSPWCGQTSGLNSPELFCGGSFAAQENVVEWTDTSPRIGVVYDLFGDGRTAVKANYARYAEALGISYSDDINVNDGGREDWDWFDPNGDGVFQFGEQVNFRDDSFPGVDTRIDPDLTSPIVDEFTVGVDHEIIDNVLFSVTGIFRGRSNDVGDIQLGRPFGPMIGSEGCIAQCVVQHDVWTPINSLDPGADGEWGTSDDGGTVVVWFFDPSTDSLEVTSNSDKFGFDDSTEYKGVSFVIQKRWSDNWQLLASYDYGKGYSTGDADDPNELFSNRRQEQFGSRPHMVKITANYLFPEPIGVNLGVFVRSNSGEPLFANFTFDDDDMFVQEFGGVVDAEELLGFTRQGNTTITVDARGEGNNGRRDREDWVNIVDIRAEKQFTIGRFGVLHAYFDVFNAFNANTITELNETLGSNWLRVDDVLPPRVIRIGGAWDF